MKALFFTLLMLPLCSPGQKMTTIAGTGTMGVATPGAKADETPIGEIHGIAMDHKGNIYVASTLPDNRILKIDTAGIISVFAGNGTAGFSGDGGQATNAQLSYPTSIAFDAADNAYIADDDNNRIRKVTAGGVISTFAGTGKDGYSGNGGAATAAALSAPVAIAADNAGNIYIIEQGNSVARKVDTTGVISLFAGSVSGNGSHEEGVPATSASIGFPNRIAVSESGEVYISELYGNVVKKVNPAGMISRFAGTAGLTSSEDGIKATKSFITPYGVACDGKGNVYISDLELTCIRAVGADGNINTVAGKAHMAGYNGDCIPAIGARINDPDAIVVDSKGVIYIADRGNFRIRAVGLPCTNLAVEEPEDMVTMKVYPNPVTDVLNIAALDKINSLEITDCLGSTVYTGKYNKEYVAVDVSKLPAGMYLVRVNNTEMHKFVKQ